MTPERWQQIEQIYFQALERAREDRAAFLTAACAGDEALRQEIEDLLAADAQAEDFIETSPADLAAGALGHAPAHTTAKTARLVPGTRLSKRYRIVGLLGQGGMGEVYRADDLKLGQPVALKFLTERLSHDPKMLAHFHHEVATAHRVTHPNVCRVHDIGETTTSAGTLHFLSMEYVDGEDLSSLLRRIGRLPADKALEIARQLCDGLAAAHEAGVLHRDLKPANVMLDGRGRARITDFGLAGLADQFGRQDVMAGTPAYLSPEQFAGKEVSVKSDIYALGLVLYEIFTGKRVFEARSLEELRRLHESSAVTNPSDLVKEIDPQVERVILRCLEKDPAKRLASARQVADALPGGDPLQATLALDETPSPEMVAAGGEKNGLHPSVAVACLAAIIIGLLLAVRMESKIRLIDVTPFEQPPEVLARKAREITAQLGYPARPQDTAYGFEYDRRYLRYLQRQVPVGAWQQRLGQSQPAAIYFWYRESRQGLVPKGWPTSPGARSGELPDVARVKEDDPQLAPGMTSLRLDLQGRLIHFRAEPPEFDQMISSDHSDGGDWAALFSAAGIEAARLTPTEAQWTPQSAFDRRAAWLGSFSEQPDLALRVEAAAWRGKPVYFEITGPWIMPERSTASGSINRYSLMFFVVLGIAVVFLGGWLAWRNLRRGRGDRKGAFRLTAFTFFGYMFAGLVGSFVYTVQPQELGIREALGSTFAIWVLYLALEPYVRRRWPGTLISWNRVLAGRWRDPVVGRDVLIGLLVGIVIVLIGALGQHFIPNLSAFSVSPNPLLRTLSGARLAVSQFVFLVSGSPSFALALLFILFVLRLLVRRDSLAVGLFTLVNALPPLLTGDWKSAIGIGLVIGLLAAALTRYGLVALASAYFVINALLNFPVTLNFSAWYAGTALLPLLAILALAAFSFYTSLGGQKLVAEKLLEE